MSIHQERPQGVCINLTTVFRQTMSMEETQPEFSPWHRIRPPAGCAPSKGRCHRHPFCFHRPSIRVQSNHSLLRTDAVDEMKVAFVFKKYPVFLHPGPVVFAVLRNHHPVYFMARDAAIADHARRLPFRRWIVFGDDERTMQTPLPQKKSWVLYALILVLGNLKRQYLHALD